MKRKWMMLKLQFSNSLPFLVDELGCQIRQESRAFREAHDAFQQHAREHGYYCCTGFEAAAIGHNLLLGIYDRNDRTEELVLRLKLEDTKFVDSLPAK